MKKKALFAVPLALLLLTTAACGGGNGKANLSGGSGQSSMAVDSAPAYAPEAPMPAPAEAEYGWASDAAMDEGFSVSESTDGADAQKPTDFTQKIIYSANLSIETLEFDASVAALERLANELGGFIESSNVSGDTRRQADGTTKVVDRWANYIIRVPAGRLQEAIHQAGNLGSITNSGMNAENITSMFTDQEARRHSLEVQEERLLDMLSRAEDVDTLIILESRLSEVRYEIESIERMLRNWQNQVDYSTLSVYLREVEKYTPTVPVQRTFGERLSDALSDGWDSFRGEAEDALLFFVMALPVLALFTLLGGISLAIFFPCLKHVRRKRAKRAAHAAAQAPAPAVPEASGPEEEQN